MPPRQRTAGRGDVRRPGGPRVQRLVPRTADRQPPARQGLIGGSGGVPPGATERDLHLQRHVMDRLGAGGRDQHHLVHLARRLHVAEHRAGSRPGWSSAAEMTSLRTGARMDSRAADLAPRTALMAADAAASVPGSAPPASARSSAGSGQAARCTDRPATRTTPPRSRTAGTARTAAAAPTAPSRSAATADAGGAGAVLAVGPGLDQLQVVVAEEPEELLGLLQRPGVVVPSNARGARGHDVGQPASMARSSGSVDLAAVTPGRGPAGMRRRRGRARTGSRSGSSSPAGGRPAAAPGRRRCPRRAGALAAQYRTASAPYSAQQVGRGHHVALGLGHLLAVRVQDPAGDRRVPPGQHAVLERASAARV